MSLGVTGAQSGRQPITPDNAKELKELSHLKFENKIRDIALSSSTTWMAFNETPFQVNIYNLEADSALNSPIKVKFHDNSNCQGGSEFSSDEMWLIVHDPFGGVATCLYGLKSKENLTLQFGGNRIKAMDRTTTTLIVATGDNGLHKAGSEIMGQLKQLVSYNRITDKDEQIPINGDAGKIRQVLYSPNEKLLAAVFRTLEQTSAGGIKILEVGTWKEVLSISFPLVSVGTVQFSSDGKFLVYSTNDNPMPAFTSGQLHVVDLATGKETLLLKGRNAIVGPLFLILLAHDLRIAA